MLLVEGGDIMPANKIVVHDKDGNILKGTTADFLPKRPVFHIAVGGIQGEEIKEIFMDNLKAIFFVKDFTGDRDYKETKDFSDHPASGKQILALFKDGETITGYTHSINMDQPGLFLVPVDPKSNNERIFIVFSSLSTLEVDGSPIDLTHWNEIPGLWNTRQFLFVIQNILLPLACPHPLVKTVHTSSVDKMAHSCYEW